MSKSDSLEGPMLISGNQAVALAALDAGASLATGYPGTPSTEILESLARLLTARPAQVRVQWAPNEKVAMEVALGAAFAKARAMVTMKHVGLNVAADVLFTAAYTGVSGSLVIVSADDPGMASSQNEQDNRRYALAAGVPMLEPADSQEAYDFALAAFELSGRWRTPVLLRMTTRVCHSKTVVRPRGSAAKPPPAEFTRDIQGRVMIPAYARAAHRKLRAKLAEIAAWGETSPLHRQEQLSPELGIIASGVCYMHAREAAPQASILKLGLTYPLPLELIRRFCAGVKRCVVVEEGDPYLYESLRAAGFAVEPLPQGARFGELTVSRVRRLLAGEAADEPAPVQGRPPQLCVGCPHRATFEVLRKLDCIVAGDIGCYTLGVLPPFEAMDTCVCMGASVGVALGMRHVLPPEQARRVVSVIGDSTFVHSGITGLVEMLYNPPPTGHVLVILDNSTTAMTGLQDHPGTGRSLDGEPAHAISYEDLARGLGMKRVLTADPSKDREGFEHMLRQSLELPELTLIVVRRPCILAAAARRKS
jgi:indolepyruvate ferredoxin oxidoreductase alpha subunit